MLVGCEEAVQQVLQLREPSRRVEGEGWLFAKMAQETGQKGFKRPQDGPKRPKWGPKKHQNGSKEAPRRPLGGSGTPQGGPKTAQDDPETAQEAPETAQDRPQEATRGPKRAQNGPKKPSGFLWGQFWGLRGAILGPSGPSERRFLGHLGAFGVHFCHHGALPALVANKP